jgi:hypothetical protein
MAQALAHAERENVRWGDLAYMYLLIHCQRHATFISEDVSDASREYGLVQPPTDRAWGAVYIRAQRNGLIRMIGAGKSRRRHASICPLWASTIYKVKDAP